MFLVIIIAIALIIMFIVGKKNKVVPVIDSIVPPVGSPGDIVVINGSNFGDTRDMSYVEFAGSKLTASSYISWSDDCIKLVLPANVQDGLVVVGTRNSRSKPSLFSNEVDIPVPVPTVVQTTKPVISQISPSKVAVGDILTITGNNFGDSRNQSEVLFTVDYDNQISNSDYVTKAMLTENMIAASDSYGEYEYWSNTEIKVRVPDGAYSGVLLVNIGKEKSEPFDVVINKTAGNKVLNSKKIYLIQYSTDISNVATTDVSTITLHCPIPVMTVSQPTVEITEVSPLPLIQNYQNCLIHQITKNRNNSPKSVFRQTFVLPVYETKTTIMPDKIGSNKNMNQNKYNELIKADAIIPSDNEKIIELSQKIIGKEKNDYRKARLIYNYMIDNYKILDKHRNESDSPLDLPEHKRGDAYDFAVIYTALLRAAKIPALIDGGVLIGQDLQTQAHWWCEFYIQNVGWVPVDVALGAGMNYKDWGDISDSKAYYFGNLDAHRITFSRGWSQFKPFSYDNKIVQYPRTFALQSIWEEASSNTAEYSSYWSLPVIKGVY